MGGRLGFLVAVAVLGLATAVPVVAGKSAHRDAIQLIEVFNAYISPRALPKTKPYPAGLTATANFKPAVQRPLPLKELLLRLDRHVSLGIKEIPTAEDVPGCSPGSGPRRRVGEIRKACGPAVVGNGRMDVEVQFPDQNPVQVASQIVALNGGAEGGTAKLYLYSLFSAPITSSIVTTMELEKIRKGRYGLEAIATIPKIAGGYGSTTSFTLTLKRGVLSATCPNGRHGFREEAVFADNIRLTQTTFSTCMAKPEAQR